MSEKFSIDQEAVRLLAALLNESGLTEIEFQQGDSRLRVVKEAPTMRFSSHAASFPSSGVEVSSSSPAIAPLLGPSADVAPGDPVTSPMVGVVYVAPEPQAPPYVRVGDSVEEGQILFIIEAMKVMNPIRAPRAGVIAKICITDASPVEFGDILLYLS